MNTVFRLVSPVYDMDMYIFKVNVFTKHAKNMHRIPYSFSRSAYSTCRLFRLETGPFTLAHAVT